MSVVGCEEDDSTRGGGFVEQWAQDGEILQVPIGSDLDKTAKLSSMALMTIPTTRRLVSAISRRTGEAGLAMAARSFLWKMMGGFCFSLAATSPSRA